MTLLQVHDQLGRARQLIVLVVADGARFDAVMIEQFRRLPRVLAGDQADLLENAQRAQRNVLKVADRGSDQVGEGWVTGMTDPPERPPPAPPMDEADAPHAASKAKCTRAQ